LFDRRMHKRKELAWRKSERARTPNPSPGDDNPIAVAPPRERHRDRRTGQQVARGPGGGPANQGGATDTLLPASGDGEGTREDTNEAKGTRGARKLGTTRGTPTAKARSKADGTHEGDAGAGSCQGDTDCDGTKHSGGNAAPCTAPPSDGEEATAAGREHRPGVGGATRHRPGGGASAITTKLGGELHNQCESRQHRIGRRTPRHRRKNGEGADDHGEERTPRRGQAPFFLPRRSACT